jgi:predicted transcriptional regulator
MNESILNINVGKPPQYHLDRAARFMETLERGEQPDAYFAIGFADLDQFLSIFTPHCWDALAILRQNGPMTIAELAQRARRTPQGIDADMKKLIEWQAVVQDEQGRIATPYAEIVVDVCLPQRKAA